MISLTNLAPTTRRTSSLVQGQTDKRMLDTKITECKIGIREFVTEVGPLVIENFSSYSDYHSPTPKVIITLTGRAKLADVRAILDIGAEVSVIILDAAKRFKIPVTYSSGIALRTIVRNKSRFVGFTDNILVTIGNTVVRTQFYIIDCLGIKVILGFLFIQKARVIFRYLRDEEDRPVFALLCDPRTGDITSVKTNIETESARDTFLYKSQTRVI